MHHKSKKEARHDNSCVARNSERLGQYSQRMTREWETAGNAAYPQSNERKAQLNVKHTRQTENKTGTWPRKQDNRTRRQMARTVGAPNKSQYKTTNAESEHEDVFRSKEAISQTWAEAPPVLTSSVVPPFCSWQKTKSHDHQTLKCDPRYTGAVSTAMPVSLHPAVCLIFRQYLKEL